MQVKKIKFKDTGYFSSLILDYLEQEGKLQPFYEFPPTIEGIGEAIQNKNFPAGRREVLVNSLKQQYAGSKLSAKNAGETFKNMELLGNENTFTITTGHQLCLFTGPLYFIYKIVSVINLCKKLKKAFPEKNFVPVYWMATEDHDFEEIDHFHFRGETLKWRTDQKGAVGRMDTQALQQTYDDFSKLLQDYSSRAEKLKKLFSDSYLKHSNHADAFRVLVHSLFSEEGLVIVDGDDRKLKQEFAPIMEEELMEEKSFGLVSKVNEQLSTNYKIQVNPREINLFYLQDGLRERIIREQDTYRINNTQITFSRDEILDKLKTEPESFSPNVLLRPLYQECILPNLAYIGGGGELAYWFQLRESFRHFKIPMPVLLLRNSAKWIYGKSFKRMQALNADVQQLFEEEEEWIKNDSCRNSEKDLDISEERNKVADAFKALSAKAAAMDTTLIDYVGAGKQRSMNHLEQLEKKIIRVQKRQNSERIRWISELKENLFPAKGLQERFVNFSNVFQDLGEEMFELLYCTFDLPEEDFIVFVREREETAM